MMSQSYNSNTLSKSTSHSTSPNKMYSSSSSSPKHSSSKIDYDDEDPKSISNYEALFDSGYNSNMQSKTFLDDFESDLDPNLSSSTSLDLPKLNDSSKSIQNSKNVSHSTQQQQQWSDSGVCITDSGLGINEDDSCLDITTEYDSKPSVAIDNNLPRTWLKKNSEGDTLLHLAIIENLEDIACSIIQNIPSSSDLINSYNYLYQTPLHLAVLKKQMNVIQQLVSRGVLLSFQDNLGNTPLHIACKYSLTDIVRFLLSLQKTLHTSTYFELRNYDGDTCFHLAAYNNNLKTIEMLYRAGANVNATEGKSGKTILHWAVENLNDKLVNFLLHKCNASVSVRTFAGQTPLHLAWKLQATMKGNNNSDATLTLKSKANKIVKLLLDKSDDPKISLETLYTDPESDFSTSDEED